MILPGISSQELAQMQIVDWGYTQELSPLSWRRYEDWLGSGLHGNLQYLADGRKELRRDLRAVFPDACSALVFLFDYTAEKKRLTEIDPELKLAAYVSGFEGEDYHHWIRERFDHITERLKKQFEGLEAFYSIDAQPVLERDLAYRAGLGWFGKNSMLISKKHGSYTIIASLVLNQKLPGFEARELEPDHCGNCTACIDHCPTEAIVANGVIDAKKCISHFTIEEFKPTDPPKGYPSQSQEVFGCDICQQVCPWNRRPLARAQESSAPIPKRDHLIAFFDRDPQTIGEELEGLSNRKYRKIFKSTALERTGRIGMLKNLKALIRS